MKVLSLFSLFFTLTLVAKQTDAHRPLATKPSCDSDYGSSDTAMNIPDPSISWAHQHYADCTNQAIWMTFTNPSADFQFYVGAGVPVVDRFASVRANALIIGPGLPPLDQETFDSLPEQVQADPIWNSNDNIGAYYHVSPQDQSTCNHLGVVMQESSTVVNGRCDFFEPFSQTNSWRVLDADNNVIPVQGTQYHVVVFLQQDEAAKFTVAVGTWVENFITQYNLNVPSCQRDMKDYYEKEGSQEECFPLVACSADDASVVGCKNADANVEPTICELGQVCSQEEVEECEIAGVTYDESIMMGSCGGQLCPAAVKTWEETNMKMHVGMMDIEYSGDADVDFVRGMIPHHLGAVDMCNALLEDLTCSDISDIDNLEGLVHFCSHVQYEQEIEVGGLRQWLEEKGLEEQAPCPTTMQMRGSAIMMPESCGQVDTPSSAALIEVNHKMHKYMAIEYSCDHLVDFVRMMLPHHASAVEMCDVVLETTQDDYLMDLCANITLTQRAEIAWMYDWLEARDLATSAPCGDCEMMAVMTKPCEDLLSTSSFCHGLGFGQDGYCKCNDTLTSDLSCDEINYEDGVGLFVPENMCKRSCGLCPSEERPLWPYACHSSSNHDGHEDEDHGDHGMGDHGGDEMGMDNVAATADETSGSVVMGSVLSFIAAFVASLLNFV